MFEAYEVLSERELEARYEVFVEQYAVKLNIEAETAASIARTMILPAAVRHLALLKAAGVEPAVAESRRRWSASCGRRSRALEKANLPENQPDEEPLEWATYMRDTVIPAMDAVRERRRPPRARSSPTTSGRCRSTRRCCSSSSDAPCRDGKR